MFANVSSAWYNLLMKIMSTYKVKIKHYNNIFKDTVSIYRNAVKYLIEVCLSDWNTIKEIPNTKLQLSYIEKLIHKTKDNPVPVYDFDNVFYKMPTYIRRAAINEAILRLHLMLVILPIGIRLILAPVGINLRFPRRGVVIQRCIAETCSSG